MSSQPVPGPVGRPRGRRLHTIFKRQGWQGLLFIAPAVILLGTLVVYPLVWTIMYSFGDTNSKLDIVSWVGFDNYERLFTARPGLPRPRGLPARGRADQQHQVGAPLHDDLALAGPVDRRPGRSRPLRVDHQGDRLRADGDRRDRGRDHLEVRLRARPRHRCRKCHRHERLQHGSDRVSRTRRHGQLRDHLRLRLGIDRLRDGRALCCSQRHP